MTVELNLPQALMLLALKNDRGTLREGFFPQGMAGAAITELILEGSLQHETRPKSLIRPVSRNKAQGAFLTDVFTQIDRSGKQRSLKSWVERLSQQSALVRSLGAELADLGVVSEERGKILGLFTTRSWPQIDHRPEAELIRRIETALSPETPIDEIDERLGLLILIAEAANILKPNLSRPLYNSAKDRLKALRKAEFLTSKDVVAVIKETEAALVAIAAGAMVAVIAAGS